MFEKDAKEYRAALISKLREKIQKGYNCKELVDIELAFQKGAEFVYNNKANKWHDLRENSDDLPKESISVLALSSDDSLDECIYIPNEGFKDPVFSTWYYPVAWIEKEKILPKASKPEEPNVDNSLGEFDLF